MKVFGAAYVIKVRYVRITLCHWRGAVFSQSSLDGNSGTVEADPLKMNDDPFRISRLSDLTTKKRENAMLTNIFIHFMVNNFYFYFRNSKNIYRVSLTESKRNDSANNWNTRGISSNNLPGFDIRYVFHKLLDSGRLWFSYHHLKEISCKSLTVDMIHVIKRKQRNYKYTPQNLAFQGTTGGLDNNVSNNHFGKHNSSHETNTDTFMIYIKDNIQAIRKKNLYVWNKLKHYKQL